MGQSSEEEEDDDENRFYTPPEGKPNWGDIGTLTQTQWKSKPSAGTPMPETQGPSKYKALPSTLDAGTSQQTEPSVRPKTRRKLFESPSESSAFTAATKEKSKVVPKKPPRKPFVLPTSYDNPSYETDMQTPTKPISRVRQDSAVPESFPDLGGLAIGPSTPSSTTSSVFASQVTPSPGGRGLRRTSPPRPGAFRPRPIPSLKTKTPTPKLVKDFRKGPKQSPNFPLMKLRSEKVKWDNPESTGWELANRSRRQMQELYRWPHAKNTRKTKLLKDRYDWNPLSKRYGDPSLGGLGGLPSGESPDSDFSDSETRHLISQSERDERALDNPVFYRPLTQMGDRPPSDIMPLGRMDFGPLASGRSMSADNLNFLERKDILDDPADWTRREQQFAQRLSSLDMDDFATYKHYRDQTDPRKLHDKKNFPIRTRLVKATTDMSIADENKKVIGTIRSQRSASMKGMNPLERRMQMERSASLPLLLPPELSRAMNIKPPVEGPVPSEKKEDKYLKKKKLKKKFSKVKECSIM